MGFSKEASRQALMDNGNNLEAALNVLLNSTKQKPATVPPLRGIHYAVYQTVSFPVQKKAYCG